jgi:hypothetical protein
VVVDEGFGGGVRKETHLGKTTNPRKTAFRRTEGQPFMSEETRHEEGY